MTSTASTLAPVWNLSEVRDLTNAVDVWRHATAIVRTVAGRTLVRPTAQEADLIASWAGRIPASWRGIAVRDGGYNIDLDLPYVPAQ